MIQNYAESSEISTFKTYTIGKPGRRKFAEMIRENKMPYFVAFWRNKLNIRITDRKWP